MTDALFVGAHPDDVEILAGGTVAKLVSLGHNVVVADATGGEMGTRGTIEERAQEGADAAAVLGVTRINLGLSDGRISEDVPAATRAIVCAIREHKPRIVFTHEFGDHHPDHNAISQAVKFACFQSNVLKYDTGQERHKPARLFFYAGSRHRMPRPVSLVVDVTNVWETKVRALKCFRSQMANKNYDGPETWISSDLAWDFIETRAGFFGSLIGTRYGEAFTADSPLRIDDLLTLPDV